MRSREPELASIASVVQRLAVLLAAGVPPVTAWGYLREDKVIESIASAVGAGQTVPQAIAGAIGGLPKAEATAWRGLAVAWAVATDAGAPLAGTLRDFAGSLRSLAQGQREIRVALAAPVSTARMVMALPGIGVLFGMALGFDTIGTLFTTPVGLGCLGVAGALMLTAAAWNRRLVRSAQPRDITPGLGFDLTAIAVSGGAAIDRARASVVRAMAEFELAGADSGTDLEAVLDLSLRAGVPAAELLRSEADERRRAAAAELQTRAAALSVRLMLPLGLCVLPAFMVLGVLPLIVSVVSSTVGGF